MFQQHESWWDLLCILDLPNNTGYIYSAEERKADAESGKSNIIYYSYLRFDI